MALETFRWATDTFATLGDNSLDIPWDEWSAFTQASFKHQRSHVYINNPSLVAENSASIILRHEHTKRLPVESSPAAAAAADESSIPVDPVQKRVQPPRRLPSRAPTKGPASNQQSTAPNTELPKRKRGRPRSQPQDVQVARQTHLKKNRIAAQKCRQRHKELVVDIQALAHETFAKNKVLRRDVSLLRQELLQLKNEVLKHARCGSWAIDAYLVRCAGDILGMKAPSQTLSTETSQSNSMPDSFDDRISLLLGNDG
ncbi:hypothetical protein K504DRAFT_488463 [Pleomassaria siparia CBS 279.74]|uniref:BZIP domain-containing protein n=1 Tax=Pleomassaria siparia CBS 279.74 TaxID=1314801 RepID=A0A6G1KMZ3_9PLEO|nr:hypothetical protein K504DRAFT_488463 [Pleomassaria siparia CBS 279.74]